MQGQSIHAPLSAPTVHKALDIGCGTGTVTHEIASQLPNTQVYGIDLSPVPNIREKLPNIEYVQANFNEVTAAHEPDSRFKKGSFDFAFSRLLVAGMIDWKDYVKRCVGLVKPGVSSANLLAPEYDADIVA
jgi:trans-aconitate methyltransferase